MLSHDVYFTLKDKSDDAKRALVAACKKYLSDHPGTVWFSAGVLAGEFERDVNDRAFDVALLIVFKDKAAHDAYQESPKHEKFIEEFGDVWESVRVFDSWLDAVSHGDMDVKAASTAKVPIPRLPDAAASFAGMIEGEVIAQTDGGIVVAVKKVAKVWESNKAGDPESLVGTQVLVVAPTDNKRHAARVSRFLRLLKVGEKVSLDVAHKGEGEALSLLELTEEQRERVKQD
ncbi:MAG: Dabb family protein [Planctomycetes bacterium]|nr:Dabb family protein [Planctomycetota bacterium]